MIIDLKYFKNYIKYIHHFLINYIYINNQVFHKNLIYKYIKNNWIRNLEI